MTTADERLTEVLRGEHAAIFGYGAVGARLDNAVVGIATAAEAAHRARRDALVARLAQRGGTPPAAEPAYTLPFAVTDQATALRLATVIEERCAALWRLVLPVTAGNDRALAIDALVDCAVRATSARRANGVDPAVVALPGAPA